MGLQAGPISGSPYFGLLVRKKSAEFSRGSRAALRVHLSTLELGSIWFVDVPRSLSRDGSTCNF